MTVRTMLALVGVVLLCVGCVSYGHSHGSNASPGTVERAKAVVREISDEDLMPAVYRDCQLDAPEVRGEMIDGEWDIDAYAANKCKGVTYRKDGVNRPAAANEKKQE